MNEKKTYIQLHHAHNRMKTDTPYMQSHQNKTQVNIHINTESTYTQERGSEKSQPERSFENN